MESRRTNELLENLDLRMTRVEQILPTLATRDEMHTAMKEAVAPLPTREEMHAAIQAATAPLATKQELREEGERTRRYTKILIEKVGDDVKLLAEGLAALAERTERQHAEVVSRNPSETPSTGLRSI
ncbi:MAG: hypothetical protein ACE148_17025 [Vicinamibacterales bacterium]